MVSELRYFYDKMAPYYDKFMEEGESKQEDEIKLVKLALPNCCRVLDVGCGTGRISIILQKEGYNVFGLDLSEEMITIARNKGLIRTYIGDFLDFNYKNNSFDGIISLHTGFSYIKDDIIMKRVIKKCKDLLVDKGVILWDSPNANYYSSKRILKWSAGNKIVETICYGHNIDRLKILFEESGFTIEDIWGSYTPLKRFEIGLPRIIIKGKKNE